MSDCERLRHDLGAYVLGALEPDEAAALRTHLARCPACAGERAALSPLPGLLDLAHGLDAAVAPPPALEESLLDRVAAEPHAPRPRRRRRAWRRRAAIAAVGLACAAAGAALLALVSDEDAPPAPAYQLALRGGPSAPGASARAALESVPGGTEVHLWVRGLRGSGDAVYEVVCESPDWRASAGTFRVDRDGRAYVVLTTAARRGEYDMMRIVRRRDDAEIMSARLN